MTLEGFQSQCWLVMMCSLRGKTSHQQLVGCRLKSFQTLIYCSIQWFVRNDPQQYNCFEVNSGRLLPKEFLVTRAKFLYFRSFCLAEENQLFLSFHEFLIGVYLLQPPVQHGGRMAEYRYRFSF